MHCRFGCGGDPVTEGVGFSNSGDKPGLRPDIDAYLRERDEDGNTMEKLTWAR